MGAYKSPVDQLLTLGETDLGTTWADYRALGIGPEHVPELIRMATDANLVLSADVEGADEVGSWAPEHALRALGQLGVAEAAEPLLEGLAKLRDIHDLWVEHLWAVLAAMGPDVLPVCERFLLDETRDEMDRIAVIEAFPKLVEEHPEARERCLEVLIGLLNRHESALGSFNGFVVSVLLDLEAVEAASAIEAAFAAGAVDESIAGDWSMVRHELGLGPRPNPSRASLPRLGLLRDSGGSGARRPSLETLKKRQKEARKRHRKRNRRR